MTGFVGTTFGRRPLRLETESVRFGTMEKNINLSSSLVSSGIPFLFYFHGFRCLHEGLHPMLGTWDISTVKACKSIRNRSKGCHHGEGELG